MSILYFEKDAYMKAYAAFPAQVSAEYSRLTAGGASLHLKKDLFVSTQSAVNELITEIKNETTK